MNVTRADLPAVVSAPNLEVPFGQHPTVPVSSHGSTNKERKKVNDEPDENPEKKFRKETIDKLREQLECPVCREVPRRGPIFGCCNGHLVCRKCQPKLQTCPICRSPDVRCRNRFAENFVSHFVLNIFWISFSSIEYYYLT
jgi:hypothetical protein